MGTWLPDTGTKDIHAILFKLLCRSKYLLLALCAARATDNYRTLRLVEEVPILRIYYIHLFSHSSIVFILIFV